MYAVRPFPGVTGASAPPLRTSGSSLSFWCALFFWVVACCTGKCSALVNFAGQRAGRAHVLGLLVVGIPCSWGCVAASVALFLG